MPRTLPGTEERYKKFAAEYVIDFNGTRAAIAAGYSEEGAHVRGSQLLRHRKVRAYIQELQSKRAERVGVKADRVLEELSRLAFANMEDYIRVNPDGTTDVDLTKLTRDQAASIQEIRVDATGGTGDGERRQVLRTTFKLADKGQNLERIGKHLKLFTDVVKHEGLESLAKVLVEKEAGE